MLPQLIVMSIQLRVPLTDLFSIGFFLDTGNLWLDPSQISASLRYGAGPGLRISTPIGPLAWPDLR